MCKVKEKVLFLQVPDITLWKRFPYITAPYGAALVVGSLLSHGYIVDHYDLNLTMNSFLKRGTNPFINFYKSLENWKSLLVEDKSLKDRIYDNIETLLPSTLGTTYDFVALGLNRITTKQIVFQVSFGLALLLALRLRLKYNCKIVIGGQVLKKIGYKSIYGGLVNATVLPIDFLFFEDGAISLPLLFNDLKKQNFQLKQLRNHLSATSEKVLWCQSPGHIEDLSFTSSNNTSINVDGVENIQSKRFCIKRHNPHTLSVKNSLDNQLLSIRPSFLLANHETYKVSLNEIFPFCCNANWVNTAITIIPYKYMYGCSNRCAFCKAAEEDIYIKAAIDVVEELEHLCQITRNNCFRFLNSQINYNKSYVHSICEEILRRNLSIYFSDSASLRELTLETCKLLRAAGCVKLWFGLESPVPRILRDMNKQLSLDNAVAALHYAHDAGIWIGVNLIVGFPHETDDEYGEVIRFVNDHADYVDCWSISALELYPHTPMAKDPRRFGIQIHNSVNEKKLSGLAFSENGGLQHIERELRAIRREEECYNIIDSTYHRFAQCDHIIFALYRTFNEKQQIKKELRRIIDKVAKKYEEKYISNQLSIGSLHIS